MGVADRDMISPVNTYEMGSLRGYRNVPPEERFWRRVTKTDTCWLWLNGEAKTRYGKFEVDGRTVSVHRWSYEHFVGPIPVGLQIDHTCGVTLCVRPDHLEPKTAGANTLAHHREQKPQVCQRGHALTEDNVFYTKAEAPGQSEKRRCRACHRLRSEKARLKKKAHTAT